MGVDLADLVPHQKIGIEELAGKSLAVDAHNALYQFLAIIRGPTGEPLKDKKSRVTSHLSGLLYRTSNLAERGIRVAYVFDGKPPVLKHTEIQRRTAIKQEATVRYTEALARGELETARKYAQATARVSDDLVGNAKRLLSLMGIPVVQAPSEGEAQAAHMAAKGLVWAAASQDYDCLLFGAPRLARNLTISGRRKLPGRDVYVEVVPEIIGLEETLRGLGITREQLVDLGILIGTDYNPDGVRGVGPKKALSLIREHGSLDKALGTLSDAQMPVDPDRIRETFLSPEVVEVERLEWKPPDAEGVVDYLCGEHDFSEDRVRGALERMYVKATGPKKATLESFFGQ